MSRAANEMLLAKLRKLGAGEDNFPNFSGNRGEQSFLSAVHQQPALRKDSDARGNRFDVRDDVRRKDDDPFAGKLRKQIAKPDTLLGIETGRGLVDNEELRGR